MQSMESITQMTSQYQNLMQGMVDLKSQLYGEKGLGFL